MKHRRVASQPTAHEMSAVERDELIKLLRGIGHSEETIAARLAEIEAETRAASVVVVPRTNLTSGMRVAITGLICAALWVMGWQIADLFNDDVLSVETGTVTSLDAHGYILGACVLVVSGAVIGGIVDALHRRA